MATQYNVLFKNNTEEAYHFAIYQEFPDAPGLRTLAFQVRGVPSEGTGVATWDMIFQTAVTKWDPDGEKFSGLQERSADLQKKYEVRMVDKDIPSINPEPVGIAGDGIILLKNETNKTLSLGFAIDRSLVGVQEVHAGETSEYYVHPTYYIAVYRNIQEGSMVDSGVVMGPVTLEFADGYTSYEVEAAIDGGKYILKNPVPIPKHRIPE